MVSSHSVKRLSAQMLLLLVLSAATSANAGEELVLIVSAHSDIESLDSSLIRKLFLGFTVTQHGYRLRPALNEADPQIKELFLQNVVSMSDSAYDRYLLRLSLLRGQTRPKTYKTNEQAINAVASDPKVVSYAWARDVAHDARIKILRLLWHD